MLRKLALTALIVLSASTVPVVLSADERQQLPAQVRPVSYDLSLVPDAVNLRFRGQVRIGLVVKAATSSIVLNEDELALDKAVVDTTMAASGIVLDPKLQRATLRFAHPIGAGSHTLTIDYHGTIGKATIGFFAMDYDSPAGKRRTIATNFEPTGERRFMPSWDEPGIKATLRVTVDVPADRMAVANMPAASTETLPDGTKRVHFVTTPKMSTYLYFLAIGDFERISTKSDGTEVGLVVNRSDTGKAEVALGEASRLLHYYNDYFGVPFPLPKLDLIVAPGTITGGSMENWGAIFYSQDELLFDPARSTEADRQEVFEVVSHEMAHQWFGDLVTMTWWDDLWLNEGFARWMQTKAADVMHPEWKTGQQALAIAERGKRTDAKPSTHPILQTVLDASQAAQAFDNITYDKGASVIGMLEAYVGPDSFRNGVRRYMRAHAFGNTVDADFWREIQAAGGKPVLDIEADFTRQPGLPLLRVEQRTTREGKTVEIREGRFTQDPATIAAAPVQTWRIPVAVSTGSEQASYLLSGATPLSVPVRGDGPIIVNEGQSAFARTLYSRPMLNALTASIGKFKPADQLGLLYDSWALGRSGYEPVTDFLEMARSLPSAADPVVWMQVVENLISIDHSYIGNPGRTAFVTFARKLLAPLATKLGWDAIRKEESNDAKLRDAVLTALGRFGDQGVIAEADRRFAAFMRDPKAASPAVRRTAISIVAYNADGKTLDRLIALLRTTRDPLEKQKLLSALTGVSDPAGAKRVAEVVVGADAPAGFAPYALAALSSDHPDLAWKVALEHVDRPEFPIDSFLRLLFMPTIAGNSSNRERIAELNAYANQHLPSSALRNVEEAVFTIEMNAKFRAERIPELDRWLTREAY